MIEGSARDAARLFFALRPDDATRAALAECAEDFRRRAALDGRPVPASRLHLTLVFLGATTGAEDPLERAARTAGDAVRAAPFELVLDAGGAFPGARVGWLGASTVPAALRQLRAAVVGSLEAAGVVPPRAADFRPHVTVQRDLRRLPDAIALPPLRWAVDGFALLRSEPGRGYACVASWPLA
ncbi:RNA 2',3'-cyclic phosphodiesterase [Cognatilysobacter tabacisoli]|uniref:RNA 2',3'-cyclic phosphodiesterase n=1 Tax=Cognatilysobacter tabacisoli TaxID=2315424 RepID=UPI000E6B465C|nr:RNA 2',3'-cyclic phosphodiesterase [Lysobacter tabacisoli]